MKYLIFSILICGTSLFSFAQPLSPQVRSGIDAFETGDFAQCIRILAALIEEPGTVRDKHLPKAHFYLAQAYYQVSQSAVDRENFPEALLRSYNHLIAAQSLDEEGYYQEMTPPTIDLLGPALYNAGTQAYNDQSYGRALLFFDKFYLLKPKDFEGLLSRGYAQWQLSDSVQALSSWEKAIGNAPEEVSFEMEQKVVEAYALSIITRAFWGQIQLAQDLLSEANKRFHKHPRLREAELALYRHNPTLIEAALGRWEDQLMRNPNDLNLKLNYARLLTTKGDTSMAITSYQEILSQNPKSLAANRFLAGYYVQKAANLIDEQPISTEPHPEAQNILRKAFPHLHNLHLLQPENPEWLDQLISLAEYLDLPELTSYRKSRRALKD